MHLRFPFEGQYPVTFGFGATSENEDIHQKFLEWGITGHHGIDFGLPEGTDVLATDNGRVIQSGKNGDFGISVTILHLWGTSFYAHLREVIVFVGQSVLVGGKIGVSGSSGAAFGVHLHFGIKPRVPDPDNGYLGFIDPTPYLPRKSLIKQFVKKSTL